MKNLFDLNIILKVIIGLAVLMIFGFLWFGNFIGMYDAGRMLNSVSMGQSRIHKMADGAFGELKLDKAVSQIEETLLDSEKAVGRGGGGMMEFATKAVSSKMIAPSYYNYSYVYKGADFSELLSEEKVVYRKNDTVADGGVWANRVRDLKTGSISLANFKNLKLNNLSVVEDRDFGYQISLSPSEDNVYIGKNWSKWPDVNAFCRNEDCYKNNRLTESDILPYDEIKGISNSFVKEYGINIGSYGKPEINESWKRYGWEEDSYIPEDVQVVYPLIVDGQEVYDESGYKTGISASVSIRYKKVSSFSGGIVNNYEASEYEAINDASKIKEMAEKGGSVNYYIDSNVKNIELELGEPDLILVKTWRYNSDNNKSEELYLPALSFPIINKPEEARIYRDRVVVHLIKEIVEERGSDRPQIEPMLLRTEEME